MLARESESISPVVLEALGRLHCPKGISCNLLRLCSNPIGTLSEIYDNGQSSINCLIPPCLMFLLLLFLQIEADREG